MLAFSGVIGCASGSLIGFMFQKKFLKQKISSDQWNQTKIWISFLRLGLVIAVLYSTAGVVFGMNFVVQKIHEAEWVFMYMVTFALGFVFFAFAKHIVLLCKVGNA